MLRKWPNRWSIKRMVVFFFYKIIDAQKYICTLTPINIHTILFLWAYLRDWAGRSITKLFETSVYLKKIRGAEFPEIHLWLLVRTLGTETTWRMIFPSWQTNDAWFSLVANDKSRSYKNDCSSRYESKTTTFLIWPWVEPMYDFFFFLYSMMKWILHICTLYSHPAGLFPETLTANVRMSQIWLYEKWQLPLMFNAFCPSPYQCRSVTHALHWVRTKNQVAILMPVQRSLARQDLPYQSKMQSNWRRTLKTKPYGIWFLFLP